MKRIKKVALLFELHQNFDRGILQGVSTYAREHRNWSLFIEEEPHLRIPNLKEWDGDGLIVNFDNRRFAQAVEGVKTKVVGLGGGGGWHSPESGIPYVTTDNVTIGRLAAEHLLERGLKEFAFCGCLPTRANYWIARRLEGFEQRLLQAGCSCHRFTGRFSPGKHWEQAQNEMAAWLKRLPKPVGILGCYDYRARHVLEACRRAGLLVPDQVAVVGVDNDMVCELCSPPLSSVSQSLHRIGYTVATVLDKLMNRGKSAPLHMIPPNGVLSRQSTDLLYVEDKLVSAALGMIYAQACHGLQAGMIAAELGTSRSTLDKRFKEILGRSVDHELRRVRLARAKELLAGTNLPLRTVASEAGFGSEQYLSAVVTRHLGCTPLAYRHDLRMA